MISFVSALIGFLWNSHVTVLISRDDAKAIRLNRSQLSSPAPLQHTTRSASGVVRISPNPRHCAAQPNATPIDPYKNCPLPGLNNMLFSQISRWYCAFRDKRALRLRDRTCNKGTHEPFRYSTILSIDYERLPKDRGDAAICWSDIARQDEAERCSWSDAFHFYGSPMWWEARALIDFHPEFYALAEEVRRAAFGERPFIALHLRRGDFQHHCTVLRRRGSPPWFPFRQCQRAVEDGAEDCFVSMETVRRAVTSLRKQHNVHDVFVATNTPTDVAQAFDADVNVKTVLSLLWPTLSRKLDAYIVEMCLMSMASVFVFNKYSSMSGAVFEMASIHGNIPRNSTEWYCW